MLSFWQQAGDVRHTPQIVTCGYHYNIYPPTQSLLPFPFFAAFSLLTLLFFAFIFLTPSLRLLRTSNLTRLFLSAMAALALRTCFLARRRARRSASEALATLRSSLDKDANFSPSLGSPFGTLMVIGAGFVAGFPVRLISDFLNSVGLALGREVAGPPRAGGKDLQGWTRSDRLANLSFSEGRARISSTHSRSYQKKTRT